MVMEDMAKFGMGCPSLLVDYMHAKVKCLTEAVNHPSPYGTISLCLLRQQARTLGNLDDTQLGTNASRHMRIRELRAAKQKVTYRWSSCGMVAMDGSCCSMTAAW